MTQPDRADRAPAPAAAGGGPAAAPLPDDGWRRLSSWAIGTRVVKALPSLIPALIGLFFLGRAAGPVVISAVVLALGVVIGLVPWLTTRYRITGSGLEVRRGLLRRQSATARLDRIRSVDVTAGPLERILGVRKVVIGTGVGGDRSALDLDPLPADVADALNVTLLRRGTGAPHRAGGPATPAPGGTPAGDPAEFEVELARLQPSWIRFAPYSLTGFAFVAAAAGIGARILNETGAWGASSQRAASGVRGLVEADPVLLLSAGIVALILLAVLISVIAYVLSFYGFRLVRRPDGALHTSRGLISTASATVERKRVRGVQVHEPILMRPPGGAKVRAVATGTSKHALLLPPAPRAVALGVADAVLGRPGTVEAGLQPHGPAARRRRYTRASLACGGPAMVLAVVSVWLPPLVRWPAVAVAVVLLASVGLASVRAANLGTTVIGDAVVIGSATVARTRTVVEFDGVVGVVTSDSLFQRRAGVSNFVLGTAAGAFTATDLPPRRAAEIAARLGPEWVTPFLARRVSE